MQKSSLSISVVIPAYNEGRLIKKTLTCIQRQKFKNFELIIVDNNSTDNTISIAKKYGARIINESQQGHVFALDKGMRESQGSIIAVTDADTKPDDTWLENIIKAFEDKDIIAITGPARLDAGFKNVKTLAENLYILFTKLNFALGKPHISGFNFAVRKVDFAKVGGLDTRYQTSSDVNLGLRLKRFGKIRFIDDIIVTTSNRRWENGAVKAFIEYSRAYIYAVWLLKPPPFKLSVIR